MTLYAPPPRLCRSIKNSPCYFDSSQVTQSELASRGSDWRQKEATCQFISKSLKVRVLLAPFFHLRMLTTNRISSATYSFNRFPIAFKRDEIVQFVALLCTSTLRMTRLGNSSGYNFQCFNS
jgi:hypothetical protein